MTHSEILRKAKALIDTPEKWTQGAFARDRIGNQTLNLNDKAVCFCSAGALGRLNALDYQSIKIINYLAGVMGDIVGFNDTHTHAEVMAKWDEAIALAEADEKEGV